MGNRVLTALTLGSLGLWLPGLETAAQDVSLMQEARNPVADMFSLPIQNDVYLGVGPDDEEVYATTLQPVYPIGLGDDWLFITRTLVPLLYIPTSVEGLNVLPEGIGDDTEFGLGDVNFTGFFSPANTGKYIWGIGPSVSIPSASDELLGSEQWSAGPSAVILRQTGRWDYGALVRHLISFAGEDDRDDVNQTLLQPWVAYALTDEYYIFTEPIITANWEQDDSDQRWLVPLGGGIGRTFYIGKQAADIALSYYHHVEKPDDAPDEAIRFSFRLLWPK